MKTLYEKHRPKTPAQFAGQPGRMAAAVMRDLEHRAKLAYLIAGTSGTGKSSLADMIVRKLQASELDVIRINAGNMTGVDYVRKLERDIRLSTWKPGGWRVYIFEEAHNLSPSAQQAFLDLLEHYPERRALIFTTMKTAGMDEAFKSRLLEIRLQVLDPAAMRKFVRKIAKKEKTEVEKADVDAIARRSKGNARKALHLLESLVTFGELPAEEEETTEEYLTAGQVAARKAVATRQLNARKGATK